MKAFGIVRARLAEAQGLPATLDASCVAFQFVLVVAYQFGGRKSDGFATWMWALSPACEGRNALFAAPSLLELGQGVDPGDLSRVSEDDAADALSGITADLHRVLQAAARDCAPDDAKACLRAADAAGELHGLFALDA